MNNLLELFSTDRGLLDSRGSLIIRQLCLNLNTERIYRTFAEILEKEEDLEFASVMVQKLNMILITSPELADFRRRLKSLETRVSVLLIIRRQKLLIDRTARWAGTVHDSVPVMVPQCCCRVLAMSARSGVRACIESPLHIVRSKSLIIPARPADSTFAQCRSRDHGTTAGPGGQTCTANRVTGVHV